MRLNPRLMIAVTALAGIGVAPSSTSAQQTELSGQVRPRLESRDPSGTGADTFTSMRVRLGLAAMMDDGLSVFIQAQDVRLWGEETSPLADFRADNLDLHQGYLRYSGDELSWLTATVGRMESPFGGQRLVGAVDWAQQGQAFDGARLDLDGSPGSVALIAYTLADLSAGPANENRQLYGAYGTRQDVGPGSLDGYWFFEHANGVTETDQHMVGARYVYSGEFDGRLEATVQRGTRADADVSAFMIGARIGTAFAEDKGQLTLWYDYLSGDDPTTPEVEVFNPQYGTNHKFYGLADLFLNIPAHTGGAGLQDLAAKLQLRPRDDLTLGAALHTFRVAQQGTLSGSHFADELDLTATHVYSPAFTATAGLSFVFQDDPLAEVGRLSENMTWFYLMLNAAF